MGFVRAYDIVARMKCALLLLATATGVCGQSAGGRDYGRSMTITGQGIVATSQILASEAGVRIPGNGDHRSEVMAIAIPN
jgi:hypothetical protein